jgi:hypothetical protein
MSRWYNQPSSRAEAGRRTRGARAKLGMWDALTPSADRDGQGQKTWTFTTRTRDCFPGDDSLAHLSMLIGLCGGKQPI